MLSITLASTASRVRSLRRPALLLLTLSTAPGGVEIDLGGMMGAKDKAVRGLTMGIAGLFKQNKVPLPSPSWS